MPISPAGGDPDIKDVRDDFTDSSGQPVTLTSAITGNPVAAYGDGSYYDTVTNNPVSVDQVVGLPGGKSLT